MAWPMPQNAPTAPPMRPQGASQPMPQPAVRKSKGQMLADALQRAKTKI